MFLLLLFASGLLLRWAWRSLAARERSGALTRRAAVLRFGVAAMAPAVLVTAAFAGVLFLEGAFSLNLVREETVRALPLAVVALTIIGVLAWVAFALSRRR